MEVVLKRGHQVRSLPPLENSSLLFPMLFLDLRICPFKSVTKLPLAHPEQEWASPHSVRTWVKIGRGLEDSASARNHPIGCCVTWLFGAIDRRHVPVWVTEGKGVKGVCVVGGLWRKEYYLRRWRKSSGTATAHLGQSGTLKNCPIATRFRVYRRVDNQIK